MLLHSPIQPIQKGLNAPYGARCFLTRDHAVYGGGRVLGGLNAPYGARCFLTEEGDAYDGDRVRVS